VKEEGTDDSYAAGERGRMGGGGSGMRDEKERGPVAQLQKRGEAIDD
jgi:hypothetical protein